MVSLPYANFLVQRRRIDIHAIYLPGKRNSQQADQSVRIIYITAPCPITHANRYVLDRYPPDYAYYISLFGILIELHGFDAT